MTRFLERIASLCGPSPLGGQMIFFRRILFTLREHAVSRSVLTLSGPLGTRLGNLVPCGLRSPFVVPLCFRTRLFWFVGLVKVHQEKTPMADKLKRKKVTQLPLIADCHISKSSNSPLDRPGVAPTLTAQLESLGGKVYQMPLSVRAARGLLLALAAWEQLSEVMKGSKYPDRPKSQ